MGITYFMQYIRGFIQFKAENGFVQRLINLCAGKNIGLQNFVKTAEGFTAVCLSKDYNTVKKLAEKVNVNVSIVQKKGVPQTFHKYSKRWGLFIGAIMLLLVLIVSQNFVWEIEINGNKKTSDKLILAELAQEKIHKWSYIPAIDFREKKQALLLRLPELSWLSVNVSGCKLVVNVTENSPPPPIVSNAPCNIVAAKTGQIRYMEVYSGKKLISENYAVMEGDTIITGNYQTAKGAQMLVHSDAKVIAEVQHDKTLSIDLKQLAKAYTGKEHKRYYLNILSEKVPLFVAHKMKGNYDVTEQVKPFYVFSYQLPFGITEKKYTFYEKKSDRLTEEAALEILKKMMKQYEAVELKNKAIIQSEDEVTMNDGIIKLTVHYTVEEDIAKKVPLV